MCLGKIAGYKINIQKSIIFINIYNEQFGTKVKKTIPLAIASKRIK